jgi:carbon-monoxide dehydrogenase medium subunit
MKPVAFDYAAPRDAAEAVALLAAGEGSAKVVAGGQSLGPMLNLRLAQPALLVDVRRIDGMTAVCETGRRIELGAGVTHAMIEDGIVPGAVGGFMRRVAADIAYRAVRNRGTIGGSLCHADPAADWVSALLLLSATLVIRGPDGTREAPIEDFMLSAFSTALGEREVLTAIRIPQLSKSARWSYRKFCRKPGEFAEALACLLDDPEREVCRAVIGATRGRPHRVADARPLLAARDERRLRAEIEAAGIDDDPYEAQLQYTILARALASMDAA